LLHFAAILLHMRRPSTLDALFTGPRQGILAATLMEPDRWWYLSDLARHLGVHHATLQRELTRLTKAEILLSKRDGNRAYYRANSGSPIFPDLRSLLAKTAGLVDELRDALLPFATSIKVAFVYGSIPRGAESSESDVDLMIVGSVGLKALAPSLGEAERRLRRPVNASVYSEKEFAERLNANGSFLRNVLSKEKLFVLGAQDELDRLAQGRANRDAQTRPRRNRRPSPGG
jgi:DNA-binding transcriptional ArsR family regulator